MIKKIADKIAGIKEARAARIFCYCNPFDQNRAYFAAYYGAPCRRTNITC